MKSQGLRLGAENFLPWGVNRNVVNGTPGFQIQGFGVNERWPNTANYQINDPGMEPAIRNSFLINGILNDLQLLSDMDPNFCAGLPYGRQIQLATPPASATAFLNQTGARLYLKIEPFSTVTGDIQACGTVPAGSIIRPMGLNEVPPLLPHPAYPAFATPPNPPVPAGRPTVAQFAQNIIANIGYQVKATAEYQDVDGILRTCATQKRFQYQADNLRPPALQVVSTRTPPAVCSNPPGGVATFTITVPATSVPEPGVTLLCKDISETLVPGPATCAGGAPLGPPVVKAAPWNRFVPCDQVQVCNQPPSNVSTFANPPTFILNYNTLPFGCQARLAAVAVDTAGNVSTLIPESVNFRNMRPPACLSCGPAGASYCPSCPTWDVSCGACSAACGGGTQVCTVTCRDALGNGVPDNHCPLPKPVPSATCNTGACPCNCNWTPAACGPGNGCAANERREDRSCNPVGCAAGANSRCVPDATCGGPPPPPPGCNTCNWVDTGGGCGEAPCGADSKKQNYVCDPLGCDFGTQCVLDPVNCGPPSSPPPPPGCTPAPGVCTCAPGASCTDDGGCAGGRMLLVSCHIVPSSNPTCPDDFIFNNMGYVGAVGHGHCRVNDPCSGPGLDTCGNPCTASDCHPNFNGFNPGGYTDGKCSWTCGFSGDAALNGNCDLVAAAAAQSCNLNAPPGYGYDGSWCQCN